MIFKYEHPEWFAELPRPDLESFDGDVIIWGTEGMGALAAHALKQRGVTFAVYCDNDLKKQGGEYFGHRIISPAELAETFPNALVLIASSSFNVIKSQLFDMGFTNVFSCYALFEEVDLTGLEYEWSNEQMLRSIQLYFSAVIKSETSSGNVIHKLSIVVTERCTLNCLNCERLVPYITNPVDFDLHATIASVQKITDAGFHIVRVNIAAAESLLYKGLPKLLSYLSANNAIEHIDVITNGTLLPDAETVEALRLPKVLVRVSDYGALSKNLDGLVLIMETSGIKYEVTCHKFWYKQGKLVKGNKTPEMILRQFENCTSHTNQIHLREDKLYFCLSSMIGVSFREFEIGSDEFVDLSAKNDHNSLRESISGILHRDKPATACAYCNYRSYREKLIKVPVAEQALRI